MAKMNHIFVGNPGVGKSTLLNCLLGEHVFESGISIGSGKTYQLDRFIDGEEDDEDRQIYLDTPGLEDDQKRKDAAQSITEALKQEGNYKVFFVVTLESGRARPIDKLVMKLVLECCEDIENYTVIINKLTKNLIKALETNEEKRNNLFATLIPKFEEDKRNTKPDADIKFLERIDELEDCDNVRVKINELNEIVDNALYMTIHKANVKDVDETGFDEKLREQEEKNVQLQKNKDEMEKKVKDLEESKKKIEAAREAERVRLEEKNKILMQEFNMFQQRIKMQNQAKQEGKVAHGVSCRVTVEHLQQSLVKAAAYKKVITSSSSFQSSYQKVERAISLSGSGGMPGIFSVSSKMEGAFKKIAAESSSRSTYGLEEVSEEKEFNPNFLQILRKVTTEVTIDGFTAEQIETEIVDSIPTSSCLTSEQLQNKSEEFIKHEYGNGAGMGMTFGPRCIFYYSDQLFVEEEKVEEKKEPEWYYIRGVESGLFLDHSGFGKKGNRLELQNKSGHDCQIWKLTEDGYIQNKLGWVMDVAMFGKCGGRVDGWNANNTIKQKWYKEGEYIVSHMNHKVLEVERRRTDRGAGIIVYKKNWQTNQQWKWIPA